MIRLAIVDDHAVTRACLPAWFSDHTADVRVVADAPSWDEFTRRDRPRADVVLVAAGGSALPVNGVRFDSAVVGARVVVVGAMLMDPGPWFALGAAGYLYREHGPDEITAAVRAVAAGAVFRPAAPSPSHHGPQLSNREREVLALYSSGLAMRQVAVSMHVRFDTAKKYLDSVRRKYAAAGREARTKMELRRRAQEDGLIGQW